MRKPLHWMGSTYKDLQACPFEVRKDFGVALCIAQEGGTSALAVPLLGFGDAGVLEAISDHRGSTYRAVYTVKFEKAVYALQIFQKKSKKGAKLPKPDADLIDTRLKNAKAHYESWKREQERINATKKE